MKKRIISLLCIITILLTTVVGCNTKKETEETKTTTKETVEQTQDTNETDKILKEIEENIEKQLPKDIKIKKDLKVGVLIISTTNPFWANMQEQYENAGKELGINVEVLAGTTEDDKISQMEMLDTMAAKGYDAIIVSPIDGTNLNPAIVKLNEAKIPVINLGPGVDIESLEEAGGHLDGKITVNFEEQGQIVVKDIVERLGGKGDIAILEGLSGAGQSEGRTKGAKTEIENHKDLKLVASQPCDWDSAKAYEATTTILKEHPDLKAIFACNDIMALAASEAAKDAGKEILIYGVDGTKDAITAIKNGDMTGSVTYSSSVYTKAALKMAAAIESGEKFDKPVYSPLVVILPETVNAYENWK